MVLVPAARMRRPDLYKSVLTGPEGRFDFQTVPQLSGATVGLSVPQLDLADYGC